VTELTYVASQVNNRTIVYPADIYFFVACVYFVLCSGLSVGAGRLSRRLSAQAVRSKS
jgi:polar amino acid transport system permease protein